jgi:hypothetical protein
MRKLTNAARLLLLGAVFLIMLSVLLVNILFLHQEKLDLYLLPPFAFLFALAFLLSRLKLSETGFLLAALGFSLAFALAAALGAQTNPVSDFALIHQAARQVASGDFSFHELPYFQRWAYQTGFVAYEAGVIKLFGAGITPLLLGNALCMTSVSLLVYLLAKRVSDNVLCARFSVLLYCFYPAPYFLASVLTNQHLSTLLMLLGVYLAVSRDGKRPGRLILSAVCIAFGNMLRPVGLVPALAVLFYLIFALFRELSGARPFKNLGRLTRSLLTPVSFFAVYLCVNLFASALVTVSGLNPHGLRNNDALWKFVVGLDPNTYGSYSHKMVERVYHSDPADRPSLERAIISESLATIAQRPLSFLYHKNSKMWASYEDTNWAFGEEASLLRPHTLNVFLQEALAPLRKLDKGYYFGIFLFAFLSLWKVMRKTAGSQSRNFALLVPAFVITLYFSVHLFVEVQTRYRYDIMPFIAALAGLWLLPSPARPAPPAASLLSRRPPSPPASP